MASIDPANATLRASELLERHEVPSRIAELRAARRHLEQLERALARAEQRIDWWHRVAFFHTTPDEAKAGQLREQRDAARSDCDAAKAAWEAAMSQCLDHAPVDIVFRIEATIDAVKVDPEVGHLPKASEKVAERLEAVVSRVRELWLADIDVVALVARLQDDEARGRAAQQGAGPRARDDALGWAPLFAEQLFRQVASALETSDDFATARATLNRERQETATLLAQLDQARAQVTWSDKLTPGEEQRERTVAWLEAEVARETLESAHTLDGLRLAIVRAFAAHPISWLYFALLAAVAVLRAAKPRKLGTLDEDADLDSRSSGAARAVILACLVEVRRACESAFAGLPERVWPRGQLPAAPAPVADSPYRLAGRIAEREVVVDLRPEEVAFFRHLEGCNVRQSLSHAVAIATVYGLASLDLDRVDIDWLDRLAIWSDTAEEQQRDRIEARIEVHERGLAYFGDLVIATVGHEAVGHHALVGLGHSLVMANRQASFIDIHGGSSPTPRRCRVFNKAEAMAAVGVVLGVMGRFFAVRGDRGAWMDDVCRRLRHARGPIAAPGPNDIGRYEHIIDLLAAQLQQTDFMPLVQRVTELRKQGGGAAARTAAEVQHLFDGALATYPPMLLFEHLTLAQQLLGAIQAKSERRTRTRTKRNNKGEVTSQRTETYYVCVIYGVAAARNALSSVTKRILDVFGPLPTPSDALEAWIAQEL